jgi:hypothetical protein
LIKRLWLSLRGWWDRKTPPRLNLYCENCGERLTNRHFCRACGASDESGWAPPDLAEDDDDDFDYDEFVQREFGRKSGRPRNVAATTWGTILIVLVVIGLLLTQFGGLL